MKRIAILGSTGSIGRSTLSVVETYPELFQVIALAAGQNVDTAFEQVRRWKPKLISMATAVDAEILRSRLQTSGMKGVEVVHGQAGTVRVATHPEVDFVVSAIVGRGRAESHVRSGKSRKDSRAGQQGMPGRSRRIDHRRGAPPAQAAPAH